MMGRSEDGRSENIVFNFMKKVSRIGPSVEGYEVLHTMLNGGKTNSSGNLYYGGAAAHINPLLDLGFAKGILFGYRFRIGGEPVPDFLDVEDFMMRPTLRQEKDHNKHITYVLQYQHYVALYKEVGYSGISGKLCVFVQTTILNLCCSINILFF